MRWCWKVNCETNWQESDRLNSIELSLLRRLVNQAPEGSINLALGELGFPFPKVLADYAAMILPDANPGYTPNAGMSELRQMIAKSYYQDETDTICVCNGAEEALYITMQVLVNPGDIVAIPDPDYPAYPALATLSGARVIRLPFEKGFSEINLDLWEEKLAGAKLLLLSNPSNPSGYCLSQAYYQRLSEIVNRLGIIMIVDEIYRDLYIDPPYKLDYELVERMIVINGLSKSHLMSGWRIGWIHAHIDFIASATKLKQYISTCSSWISQKLALFALDQEEIPRQNRQMLRSNQRLAMAMLSEKNLHIPPSGPYIMFQVQDSLTAAFEFMQRGVITAPGVSYGESSKDWIRINIALPEKILHRALKRLQ